MAKLAGLAQPAAQTLRDILNEVSPEEPVLLVRFESLDRPPQSCHDFLNLATRLDQGGLTKSLRLFQVYPWGVDLILSKGG